MRLLCTINLEREGLVVPRSRRRRDCALRGATRPRSPTSFSPTSSMPEARRPSAFAEALRRDTAAHAGSRSSFPQRPEGNGANRCAAPQGGSAPLAYVTKTGSTRSRSPRRSVKRSPSRGKHPAPPFRNPRSRRPRNPPQPSSSSALEPGGRARGRGDGESCEPPVRAAATAATV